MLESELEVSIWEI